MHSIFNKVQVWIYHGQPKSGAYFFLLLCTLPSRGSFWQPVTGHVEGEESLEEAALREAQEETGLNFLSRPIYLDYSFRFESQGRHLEEFVFVLPSQKDVPRVLDAREHQDSVWATIDQVKARLGYPSNQVAFEKVLAFLNRYSSGGV